MRAGRLCARLCVRVVECSVLSSADSATADSATTMIAVVCNHTVTEHWRRDDRAQVRSAGLSVSRSDNSVTVSRG